MNKEYWQCCEAAARLIVEARSAISLTGAGISVPSGIPDFRSPGGLWERLDPMEYATIDAFRRNPGKSWVMFHEFDVVISAAKPNKAHAALARLESLGLIDQVITQNVDGLHQAAGSAEVVELHGNVVHLTCPTCGWKAERAALELSPPDPPLCPSCGAIPKPDIVLFGEPLPEQALSRAFHAAEQADVILVAGTSGTVAPASVLPTVVHSRKGTIIEMALEPTAYSRVAGVSVLGDLSRTLPDILSAVEAALQKS